MQRIKIPIHHHPQLERDLHVPEGHVIVDWEICLLWEKLGRLIEENIRQGTWSTNEIISLPQGDITKELN
jgi:hypothetical protein